MKLAQVAVQLYTVREFLQIPAQVIASLYKLKEIGYQSVQLSAGSLAGFSEMEIQGVLSEVGLICCSTHEPGEMILNSPEKVAQRLQRLGCRYTAYPMPKNIQLDSQENIYNLAEKLNHAGRILYESGITLAYHNHALEFRQYNGQTMLEIIYNRTDSRYVQAEIDTYWVQFGGNNPVEWCRRLAGRLPLLHLKDYMITSEHTPTYAEIGSGNLDFKAIIQAADKAGCRWYIVEQDTCPGDPFDSLAHSLNYIQENLCER